MKLSKLKESNQNDKLDVKDIFQNGSADIILDFIEQQSNDELLKIRLENGDNLLHLLTKNETINQEEATNLLKKLPQALLKEPNNDGWLPAQDAFRWGSGAMISTFIKHYPNQTELLEIKLINEEDEYLGTCTNLLHLLAQNQIITQEESSGLLRTLSTPALLGEWSQNGLPIDLALELGSVAMISAFIELHSHHLDVLKADANYENFERRFLNLIRNTDMSEEEISNILQKALSIPGLIADDVQPLAEWVFSHGHDQLLSGYLKYFSSEEELPKLKLKDGNNILHMLAANTLVEHYELDILEKMPQLLLQETNNNGWLPVQIAFRCGSAEMISNFIKNYSNQKDLHGIKLENGGHNLLHLLAENYRIDKEEGANLLKKLPQTLLKEPNNRGWLPVQSAFRTGPAKMISVFMHHPSFSPHVGTPLHNNSLLDLMIENTCLRNDKAFKELFNSPAFKHLKDSSSKLDSLVERAFYCGSYDAIRFFIDSNEVKPSNIIDLVKRDNLDHYDMERTFKSLPPQLQQDLSTNGNSINRAAFREGGVSAIENVLAAEFAPVDKNSLKLLEENTRLDANEKKKLTEIFKAAIDIGEFKQELRNTLRTVLILETMHHNNKNEKKGFYALPDLARATIYKHMLPSLKKSIKIEELADKAFSYITYEKWNEELQKFEKLQVPTGIKDLLERDINSSRVKKGEKMLCVLPPQQQPQTTPLAFDVLLKSFQSYNPDQKKQLLDALQPTEVGSKQKRKNACSSPLGSQETHNTEDTPEEEPLRKRRRLTEPSRELRETDEQNVTADYEVISHR